MATIGANMLTLSDIAKLKDPSGRIGVVAEMLSQTNRSLTDIPWVEGNLDTGHQVIARTSLPSISWKLLNGSVTPTKATTAQAIWPTGIMESWVEVDKDVAELGGDANGVRMDQAKAHVESMGQEFTQTMFYGNAGTAPEEFNGLATHYAATSGTNGQNVVLGGGAGSDNSSIWLVGWGKGKVYGIYPKGSKAGLTHDNLGVETLESTAGIGGTRSRVYRDRFQWKCGICVEDWRYVARVANIDISNLVAKSSAADLFDLMIKASHRIQDLDACNPVYYMNRSCYQMLDIQGRDDVQTGGQLTYESVGGKRLMSFRGIPVRLVDQLTEAEATIS